MDRKRLDYKIVSSKDRMDRRSHHTVWTLMVRISQALQTPEGSIQGRGSSVKSENKP